MLMAMVVFCLWRSAVVSSPEQGASTLFVFELNDKSLN